MTLSPPGAAPTTASLLRLHHAQPLGLHLILVHGHDDLAEALWQMDHREAAAELQHVARSPHDVHKPRRELMACARDAAHLVDLPVRHGAVRRIGQHGVEGFGGIERADLAVVALPDRDARLELIHVDIARRELRHDGADFHGFDVCNLIGDEERDDARARAELQHALA